MLFFFMLLAAVMKYILIFILVKVIPHEYSKAGVYNIRPRGHNWAGKDCNLAHWMALENVREEINFGLQQHFFFHVEKVRHTVLIKCVVKFLQ